MKKIHDGLMVVEAQSRTAPIGTDVPTHEVAATVLSGNVVIVRGAFDRNKMRMLRASILASDFPFSEPNFDATRSWRYRRAEEGKSGYDHLYDNFFFAVNDPTDLPGREARATVERLAAYWRALTYYTHTFVTESGRRALRPWAFYYPAGGGCFGWHTHQLDPTKIGTILGLSEMGVDFNSGGNEFVTPYGPVNTEHYFDIGDLCLFRYDQLHRVTVVDPDRDLSWDGLGRWTIVIQGDPRPPDQ